MIELLSGYEAGIRSGYGELIVDATAKQISVTGPESIWFTAQMQLIELLRNEIIQFDNQE